MNEMGRIGREEKGVNRLALNDSDGEARDLFTAWLEDEGLDVKIDRIGNIFGVRKGTDPNLKPVMVGSHLDTVREAGVFDGALGVLSGLEIIRLLNQHDFDTVRTITVAAFTNEEGARFQPDMMGSMVYSGHLDVKTAWSAADDDGVIVKDELKRIGYLGTDEAEAGAFLSSTWSKGLSSTRRG